MSKERFKIKPQDDYWAVVDEYNEDKVCIINGIHTEIEAIWLCTLLNDQQATINELKEENKKLKRELNKQNTLNTQLREINKELGDDLYNCRSNKNIISEKLKLWQDTLTEYDIYTIKDLTESFELDAKINKEKDDKIKELEVKVLNLELEKEELMRNE